MVSRRLRSEVLRLKDDTGRSLGRLPGHGASVRSGGVGGRVESDIETVTEGVSPHTLSVRPRVYPSMPTNAHLSDRLITGSLRG